MLGYRLCTIDGESFAGLNFCSFDPMKYFAETLSRFIGAYVISIIIKEVFM